MLVLLIATVPWRRPAFRRLLASLPLQTRRPDLVYLYLDGYGEAVSAPCALPTRERRTAVPGGPGGRWSVIADLAPADVVVNLDDDVVPPAGLIAALAGAVEPGRAAAATGITVTGKKAPAEVDVDEPLICAGGATLAFCAGDLFGLVDMAKLVGGGVLGDCGDDEAMVSACLWKNGVTIKHVRIDGLGIAADTQAQSQTRRRLAVREPFWAQRQRIAAATGWPWPL